MKNDPSVSINEIFYSIQGEAKNTGKPTVFIRTAGCPFRCSYCDTDYAFTEGKQKKISEVIKYVKKFDTKYITVTGGEPLAQKNIKNLLELLISNSYDISLETSGLIDISSVPEDIEIVMDIKTPSSNEESKNIKKNLSIIKKTDVLKFVIGDKNDYEWSKEVLSENNLINFSNIYFSPVHDLLKPKDIAKWILDDNLKVTLQLQIHKYIWGNERAR
ncbi:MAG: radical SAM protein [Gammaproteobacteria bacterium]|jgi:7-carboxy-7-deazaguanine synthase|nr:radical SAM protein [Gammaproteobacteria bacterium]MBT6754781.1 radical SAM protein [Gammaproteobacteria bacterium]MBT7523741.1 radical SAM protein [Gammaproteobacteria bacterium]|tara:strand:+ start:441 stop:1091 length:651 start_codon:yes stop_codon:yes gene_type:complete